MAAVRLSAITMAAENRTRKKHCISVRCPLCLNGLFIFILLHAKGAQIVRLFLDESNTSVLTFAASGAEIYAFAFLINGLNIIFSGYFTAIGKPAVAAIISGSKGILFVAVAIRAAAKNFRHYRHMAEHSAGRGADTAVIHDITLPSF